MSIERLALTSLKKRLGSVDVLICSASFEERCKSIPSHIDHQNIGVAFVTENENHRGLHLGNGEYLLELFGDRGHHVLLDTTNPLRTADGLFHAVSKCAELRPRRVLVDITTFTHEAFLILFRLLRDHFRGSEVVYAYAGAAEYSVGEKDESKWLSKGIGEIRSVLGYAGRFLPSRKLHLIVLVGFEHERVNELIRQFEPSYISLGYGESTEPGAEKHHPVNLYGYGKVKAVYGRADAFIFYCYDPVKTKKIVQAQAKRVPATNVVVAALNTKLSTLGVALAALETDSIQICYPQALLYNYAGYSQPGKRVYLFQED